MLTGFKAQNHPQQTGARGARDDVDDRGTEQAFVDSVGVFDLDVAAASHNTKAPCFYSIEDDGLIQPWSGRVWCNPPYSDIRSWVEKAWAKWRTSRCDRIVMLLPANRTEQGWWQDLVEPELRRGSPRFHVEFLRGRMRFDRPGWTKPTKGDRPPFGCCLLIWDTSSANSTHIDPAVVAGGSEQ